MSIQRFVDLPTEMDEIKTNSDKNDIIGTKLERRRRIEALEEEKRLKQELQEFEDYSL